MNILSELLTIAVIRIA